MIPGESADVGRFVVVAAEGAARGDLVEVELRWGDEGLFRVDGWPKVVAPADLGLKEPAAAWFVAAEVSDAVVADRIVKYLAGRGFAARVVAAPGTARDLRVIWADSLTLSGNGAPLFAYDVCLMGVNTPLPTPETRRHREAQTPTCLARARPDPQFGGWFIVSPRITEELMVWADAGEPWRCRTQAIGLAPDRPMWLHGPISVSCLAPPVEVPSR